MTLSTTTLILGTSDPDRLYAECCYTECHQAECRSALFLDCHVAIDLLK